MENAYDMTVGALTGSTWERDQTQFAGNKGAGIGQTVLSTASMAGGMTNDFWLNPLANTNDFIRNAEALFGVKDDANPYMDLQKKNAENMKKAIQPMLDNGTMLENLFIMSIRLRLTADI